jgi:hypothetical protein
MTLIDPRESLADQSSFIDYLVGLAGLARVVHTLAADSERQSNPPGDADDFVHLLLGFASLGEAIEGVANPATAQQSSTVEAPAPGSANGRWLR